MPTNFYFQKGDGQGTTNEQRLIEDLIIESLKIYGHDCYYIPRTVVNKDKIFDEQYFLAFDLISSWHETVFLKASHSDNTSSITLQ